MLRPNKLNWFKGEFWRNANLWLADDSPNIEWRAYEAPLEALESLTVQPPNFLYRAWL